MEEPQRTEAALVSLEILEILDNDVHTPIKNGSASKYLQSNTYAKNISH